MGLTQSTENTGPVKKYTDNEIRNNIQNLFNNNRENNFSEASYSIKDLENMVVSDTQLFQGSNANNQQQLQVQQLGGSNIKFNSSKNRHLMHNIQDYINTLQSGGNPNNQETHQEISDLSEFQKIKDFLLNDIENKQSGGNAESILDSLSSPSNKMTLVDALRKITLSGGAKGGADDDEDDEDDEDDDLDLEGKDDDDEDEDEEPDVVSSTSSLEKKSESVSDVSAQSDENPKQESISATSDAPVNSGKFSDTSYSQKVESELNIVPFYSSSESDNKHPYTKNRFN